MSSLVLDIALLPAHEYLRVYQGTANRDFASAEMDAQ